MFDREQRTESHPGKRMDIRSEGSIDDDAVARSKTDRQTVRQRVATSRTPQGVTGCSFNAVCSARPAHGEICLAKRADMLAIVTDVGAGRAGFKHKDSELVNFRKSTSERFPRFQYRAFNIATR